MNGGLDIGNTHDGREQTNLFPKGIIRGDLVFFGRLRTRRC